MTEQDFSGSSNGSHGIKVAPVLEEVLGSFSRYLPLQVPLQSFVHLNILQSFEEYPFEEAVLKASSIYGTQPYQSEKAFAEHLYNGRILRRDLEAVLKDEMQDGEELIFYKGPSLFNFRLDRLQYFFEVPGFKALEWQLKESTLLEKFSSDLSRPTRRELLLGFHSENDALTALWNLLLSISPEKKNERKLIRRSDQIKEVCDLDLDRLIHPFIIRFCAAFLDQGISYWPLPRRETGLLNCFRELYGLRIEPPERWRYGLGAMLRRQLKVKESAEETIERMLGRLGVPPKHWGEYLRATLMSLRGWAGMINVFEKHPEKAPIQDYPASLIDYLAIFLTLDVCAYEYAVEYHLKGKIHYKDYYLQVEEFEHDLELVYEAFVTAQAMGFGAQLLSESGRAEQFLEAVRNFNEIERRRIYHLAYERRHRISVLDGLYARDHLPHEDLSKPWFQAVFCIDEREESLRRYLEDLYPSVETFGYAGFFGVAMQFQGVDDVRPRPLCPPVATAGHYVKEELIKDAPSPYFSSINLVGKFEHFLYVSSKTLVRGGILSVFLGLLSVIPLIVVCLFPRLAEKAAHLFYPDRRHLRKTKIHYECCGESESEADYQSPRPVWKAGYTISEMANIVFTALKTMGIDKDFSDMIFIVGHGSSSLNNPHRAAYDCGATGGGKGGPNARVFVSMANKPEVRKLVAEKGINIPDQTYFIAAYHNTCDDSVTYYEEELIPSYLLPDLERAKVAFHEACGHDARERCRRFMSASLDIDFSHALAHVEARSHDLAQPRPECGHATNAICIVGRRSRTRGLFLDRRAFLVSYDPFKDPSGDILANLLDTVGPVGSGISLDYYFSYVDPQGFGSGSKLPHNVTGLIGVMDGSSSDLRTGLPWQAVEIHEPVRLLNVVEVEPEMAAKILEAKPSLKRLVQNSWIQFVAWSPSSDLLYVYTKKGFELYEPENTHLKTVNSSEDIYDHDRGNLPCLTIVHDLEEGESGHA